jgi:agmatine/peptidylarginine deiminase
MLTWPHDDSDWAPFLPEVEPVFVRVASEIAKRQPLLVVCRDARHRAGVLGQLRTAGVDPRWVVIALQSSNDSWVRDHGPIGVVTEQGPLLLDFQFNGWGGKYPACLDNAISAGLQGQGVFGAVPLNTVDLVLEGGAIETDGQGTMLGVSRCLLDPRRNPGISRAALEERLHRYLGFERFLWMEHGGLAGDDTDGHIDTLVRFSDPRTLVYQSADDPADVNHAALRAMAAELAALRDAQGRPYRLRALPVPRPIHNPAGHPLPASYANFLIINGALLVPNYRDAADTQALEVLAGCFPGRDIIGIDCHPLIQQYGSLHCVTLQLPRGVLNPFP